MRTILLLLGLLASASAHAQQRTPEWIIRAERWAVETPGVSQIGHSAVAVGITAGGKLLTGNAWYGAMAASGFYIGLEGMELLEGENYGTADRLFDLLGPILASTLTAWWIEHRPIAPDARALPVIPIDTPEGPPAAKGRPLAEPPGEP